MQKQTASVSVVITTHLSSNLLYEAVQSVLKCKFIHEVIIVLDKTDIKEKTIYQELIKLSVSLAKCRIISNKFRKGVSGSRNTGIDLATGKYIVFLDYDDYFLEERFDFLEDLNNTEDVFLNEYFMEKFKDGVRKIWKFTLKKDFYLSGSDFFVEYNYGIPHLSCFTVKREALLDSNIRFDEELTGSEDTLFKFQLINKFGFVVLKNSHNCVIRLHENNTTKNIYTKELVSSRFKYFRKASNLMSEHYTFFRHSMRGCALNIRKIFFSYPDLILQGVQTYFHCFMHVKMSFRLNFLRGRHHIKSEYSR